MDSPIPDMDAEELKKFFALSVDEFKIGGWISEFDLSRAFCITIDQAFHAREERKELEL